MRFKTSGNLRVSGDRRLQTAAPFNGAPSLRLDKAWVDRDLSWLEFNRRVLAEALDRRTPLLERLRFLAIFTANLDEFFMKRMALLREHPTAARRTLLRQIRRTLEPMLEQQAACFRDELLPALGKHGIHLWPWEDLSAGQREEASRYFDREVSAALTPLVIAPSQPFPFFSNLSQSLHFVLRRKGDRDFVHGRVKVPAELPQWVRLHVGVQAGECLYVRLHEVISANARKLYAGMQLGEPTLFRLTRDAEVELDEDAEQSIQDLVKEQIRQRRFEPVVRLEFAGQPEPNVVQLLVDRFGLAPDDVYVLNGELDYSGLLPIADLDKPALRYPSWTPVTPPRLEPDADIFDVIQGGDVLVHHPYESFDESVERFVEAAARDPRTLAIKMTVYRVGDDTPFVRTLIAAAESGKQVACVIELKARFDEARNLHWAAELGRAGAHVTLGDIRLKTHAKVALVVRRERGGLRTYAHIGTGNYHVKTARIYTDIGLFTCNPALTADVVKFFHYLTGRSESPDYETLLVAPTTMRQRFLDLITREIEHKRQGRPARIIAQMNQLEDRDLIAALCEASQAGVPIDLVVRGFCCLRPGIKGLSENIRIRSIVGRFLEHARIFYFAAGTDAPLEGEYFIGSADWMTRNLSWREEVVAPVLAKRARARLWEALRVCLEDRQQAWLMNSDGTYRRSRDWTPDGAESGTHDRLMALARRRATQSNSDALSGEGTTTVERPSTWNWTSAMVIVGSLIAGLHATRLLLSASGTSTRTSAVSSSNLRRSSASRPPEHIDPADENRQREVSVW